MTSEESFELANVVRACVKVVGCNFPISLIGINVGMIHLPYPPVFIFVRKYMEYKCIYMPCIIYGSRVVLRGRNIV